MTVRLVGAMKRAGRFTDRNTHQEISFDNLMLYALEPLPEVNEPDRQEIGDGFNLIVVKIKWRDIFAKLDYSDICTIDDFKQFYGQDIDVDFDSKGNVLSVKLLRGD